MFRNIFQYTHAKCLIKMPRWVKQVNNIFLNGLNELFMTLVMMGGSYLVVNHVMSICVDWEKVVVAWGSSCREVRVYSFYRSMQKVRKLWNRMMTGIMSHLNMWFYVLSCFMSSESRCGCKFLLGVMIWK